MRIDALVILLVLLVVGEVYAVRSSSRNFKSLKRQKIEKAEAAKAAEEAKLEAEQYSGVGDFKPAVERVTFLGPKNGWGFVKKESTYYSPQGKNLGALKAGTLFKYQDVKSTSQNDMLLSYLRDKTGWHGPYLLPCTEIAAYEGDPETVDIQIVAELRRYFLLKGEYDQYREELLTAEYKKNPHYELYKQAVEQYKASVEKASKMESDAAELTGIAKTKAYDELRKLKYSQAELKVDLEKTAAKYKAWKKQNPVDENAVQDDKLRILITQLNSVKNKVPDLIPSEE